MRWLNIYLNLFLNSLKNMKIKNFSTYEFNKYNVVGVKAKINFVKTNNLEIITHEELSKPIEEQSINLVKEFEPLLFSADIETTKLVNDKELNIDHLTLLDGHHRYDFIIRNVIDLPIEVIIISSNDVNVDSHLSEIKITKAEFLDFLKSYKFKLNSNSNVYLKVDNDVYSSDEIFDIYDLYNFKRECFEKGLISPFPNDSIRNNENILSFTPIKLEEFYKENYLFPPKSTWITPRI